MSPIPLLQGAAIFLVSSSSLVAAEWSSDYTAARKQAAAEKKDLLIDFTGSDWCAWCIKLRKEVFAQPSFAEGTKDRYVLVELDYPKDKTGLPVAVVKQNEELLKKYPIKGYPSILLCDAGGRPFAVTGYQAGGPGNYLKHLDGLQARKAKRDEGLSAAAGKTGVEKARQLVAVLDALELDPPMMREWYADVCSQIKEADPADETGFAKREAAEIKFASFMTKLLELRTKQDLEGVAGLVDATLADPAMQGELRIPIYGHYAGTLAYADKKDEAIAVLRKGIAEDPGRPGAKELQEFIAILEREKAGLPPVDPARTEE